MRGARAEPATDVYAFGAVLYELLAGRPVFSAETAADSALAHASSVPEPPSSKAPRGWVTRDVDRFVIQLLAKAPEKRPRDASEVLEGLEPLGQGPASIAPTGQAFPEDCLNSLIDALIADPEDAGAVSALEEAIAEGADPEAIGDAFIVAAEGVVDDSGSGDAKRSLLERAARTFEVADNRERAEKAFVAVLDAYPDDAGARAGLERVRKALGKYAEVVEALIARSAVSEPGEARARIFAEIRAALRDRARRPGPGDPGLRERALRGPREARAGRRD